MQVESVRENSVAQAKLHAEAEKKEVGLLQFTISAECLTILAKDWG
jgi:hypothetical protein